MKLAAALSALLMLGALVPTTAAADDPNNPCAVPGSEACRNSPDYDPWWWEGYYPGPEPVTGPICQNQVGDEGAPPSSDPRENGCVLP